ncbi:aminotransferase class I/II-fold pyridoxal phosphate-dependent enzyme [Paraglaciecola sp.]|uniref:aminotransferase class I/II-fold pyridoxal phosphate-dependent enzyme n=1 Tax=Paraglaciecola sp. TaxID=1920173 RepID=UPI0030F3EC7A
MKVNISGGSAIEIFESVRVLTNKGALSAGDSLPPVRELAEQLGVNRNTVSSAYQRLTKAGIAVTRGRLGTSICQVTDAGEQEGVSDTALFDLADGSPRREWLPNLTNVANQSVLNQYLYGEVTILPEIYQYAKNWFANSCPSEFDVTLCNGAIDTLERMVAAHLIPGDKIVVEDPCYISSANSLRLAGIQIIGAAVDEQGMSPQALKAGLDKGAKAVLITPRAHNPTGASISAARAEELKAILARYPSVLIMEDDHFSLMAKTEHHSVIPKNTTHWAIFRSVSKGLGPDLRMAFVAADKESIKRINTRLAPGMSWVSRVLQSFVYACLTKKEFQQHLAIAKQNCAERREVLLDALTEQRLTVNTAIDGLNVWLPVGKDCKSAAYEFSRKGWLVRPGDSFDIDQTSQAIRISVQNLEPETAKQFALDAASIIK